MLDLFAFEVQGKLANEISEELEKVDVARREDQFDKTGADHVKVVDKARHDILVRHHD